MGKEREEWRPIVGYEGLYEVSNLGRVKSLERDLLYQDGTTHHWKGKILRPLKSPNKYLQVLLRKNNQGHYIGIHRLVALSFVDGYKDGLVVNHLDENPTNNRANNLEWCTQRENNIYGTKIERCINRLSIPIIQLSLEGDFIKEWKSQTEASRQLKIDQSHIWNCLNGNLLSSFGFRWIYKKDYERGKRLPAYNPKTGKKRVAQLDCDGTLIRIWNSTREIERELGFYHGSIGLYARGSAKKDSIFGYKWKYI